METGRTSAANETLRAAVAAAEIAAGQDALFDSAAEKTERLLLAQRLRVLAEAIAVSAAGASEMGGVASANRVSTPAMVVATQTSMQPARVDRDCRLARWLRSFPILDEAFRAGRVSRQHLERLQQLDTVRTHATFVDHQSMFIEHAEQLSWRDFLRAIRYWMLMNDPDGEEPREQLRSAGVRARKDADGSVTGSFKLDPVRGEAFMRAFETELNKLRLADDDTGVLRTRFQRGADALLALIGRGFARPDGTIPVPLVDIVMSELVAEQLLDRITGQTDPDEPFDLDPEDPDHRCELIDGTPLHPWFAASALSVGQFRRHVFDAEHKIIETSKARTFPASMKHIFNLESRGRCKSRGCDAPFNWLQADHVNAHAHGGETSLNNGQNLCGNHNRIKGDRPAQPKPIETNAIETRPIDTKVTITRDLHVTIDTAARRLLAA